MKRNLLLIISLLGIASFSGQAQKVVSLHQNGNITNYYQADGFQLAYADALNGDTIILPGGSFAPPTTFEKQLTIFGAGHYSAADSPTGKSIINGNIDLKVGADNSYFEGLYISGSINTTTDVVVNNLMFKRCLLASSITFQGDRSSPCNNISFIQCVLQGDLNLENVSNAGIYNSILEERVVRSEASEFKNNIFLRSIYILNYSINDTFEGNIFFNSQDSYLCQYSDGNTFSYNIIRSANPNYGTNPQITGNWTGVDVSTLFVNQTGAAFSYEHDYHLDTPESYAYGASLTPGIYSGIFPYKPDAVPAIPHIKSKTISAASDENGMIQVNIEVEAQDE